MKKEQLTRELIKVLEKEKGGPVRLMVDTPKSARWGDVDGDQFGKSPPEGREYFGRFDKRSIEVKRVKGLKDMDPEYDHDVELLEGSYANLRELNQRIWDVDLFYRGICTTGSKTGKAYDLLCSEAKKGNIKLPTTAEVLGCTREDTFEDEDKEIEKVMRKTHEESFNTYTVSMCNVPVLSEAVFQKAKEILDQHNMPYLAHKIEARPDGLYHNKSPDYDIIDETKIADINFNLIE